MLFHYDSKHICITYCKHEIFFIDQNAHYTVSSFTCFHLQNFAHFQYGRKHKKCFLNSQLIIRNNIT